MTGAAFIYLGSAVIFVWGIAHLAATRPVVDGFGPLSPDNRRVITMEWILEGATPCFLGVLPALVESTGGRSTPIGSVVIRACVGMPVLMAIVSAFTGARTSVVPTKACPIVKSVAAALYAAGLLAG